MGHLEQEIQAFFEDDSLLSDLGIKDDEEVIIQICEEDGSFDALKEDDYMTLMNISYDEFEALEDCEDFEPTTYLELSVIPTKWNRSERRLRKKMIRRAHKGTNWKYVPPKQGWKRVKIGRSYIRVRLSPVERQAKRIIATAVGRKSAAFKR